MDAMIEIQRATDSRHVPDDRALIRACEAALEFCDRRGEVAVRITDNDEMQALNQEFRNKPVPTNVLSFPAGVIVEDGATLLGDIVLCAPVIEAEAAGQGKTTHAHYAHMVVHGTLHLLGYDHIDDNDAGMMEQCEREVLAQLGIDDPYQARQAAISHAPDGQRTSLNG